MNKRGSILIIALWILTILVVFAVTIGHRASLNLKLARFQRDSLKANFLAQSDIHKAIAVLENDGNEFDALNEEWATGKDASGMDTLKNITISDEERSVNINGINEADKNRIFALLSLFNVADAQELAILITDWQKSESTIEPTKKDSFKIPEELLAALEYFYKENKNDSKFRDRAREVFNKIKRFITASSNGKININTCPVESLKVLIMALPQEGTPLSDSENLIQKIIQFRASDGVFDKLDFDDMKAKLKSTDPELTLSQLITNALITVKSENFSIQAAGRVNNASNKITAIYNTDEHKIVSWRQNL